MRHIIQTSAMIVLLGVLLFGCETTHSPNTDLQLQADRLNSSVNTESGTKYDLKDGEELGAEVTVWRTFNEEKTTFTYEVRNRTSALQFFNLDLPNCLDKPVYTPELGENGLSEDDKISWNQAISANPSAGNNPRTYTITYEGDIPVGSITAEAVTGNNTVYSGSVAGPVCPSVETDLTFSGSVYIDANKDGNKDPEEYGLDNIEVSLYSLSGGDETFIVSTITGETGEFSFNVSVPSGDFRIKVPANKVDNIYYQATVTSKDFTDVNDDVEDIHFAYTLNIAQMTEDLLNGEILKNTKSTQYWAFQLQHAAVNQRQVEQNPNVDFTRNQMLELLETVEELLPIVEIPFQFEGTGRNKINDALSILRGQKYEDSEVSELMKELLTAELNVANTLGALTPEGDINNPFNRAILIFGEAIACNALGTCPGVETEGSLAFGNLIVGGTDGLTTNATLSDGTTVLRAFNGTGGIGSI